MSNAAERSLALTKLFIENGAYVNHDLFGKPACWPLLTAVHADKLDVAKYLVELGAVVNFVNIHGLSPLDYAKPGTAMHEYLLSLGAVPGAELPRDHLPQSEPEVNTHESIRGHIATRISDKIEDFPLREIVPGDPPFTILKVAEWDAGVSNDYVALVTDGVSAHKMPVPDGVEDAIRRAEFAVVLPSDWPLDKLSMQESRYCWPFDWLRQIARWPFESGSYYRRDNIIANGEPPEPLGEGTAFTCWLITTHYGDAGRFERPDGETVELVMLSPLLTAERDYEKRHGMPALQEKLDDWGVGYAIHLNRGSAVPNDGT